MNGTEIMKTVTRKRLTLPFVFAAAVVAMTGGVANAALGTTPNGTPVPLTIQAGSNSLPSGTQSLRVSFPDDRYQHCIAGPFSSSTNIATGDRTFEGQPVEVRAYRTAACGGANVASSSYRVTYTGPAPKSGFFTEVRIRVINPLMVVCTDRGWSDNNPGTCR